MTANRLTYPPAQKQWHIVAWEWQSDLGYWLLRSCNFVLRCGDVSRWIPPRDGTQRLEVWIVAERRE